MTAFHGGNGLRLSLTGGALVLACCASAQQAGMEHSTPDGVDARGLASTVEVELRADGSRRQRVVEQTAVLSDHAVDALGDPRLRHNKATQSLQVVRAETTMRDGTRAVSRANAINETTPDTLVSAPAYTALRETVVTHVGLERGATTLLEYVLSRPATNAPLWGEVPLRRWYPVARQVVQLSVPEGTSLRWRCLGCEVEPEPAAGGLRFTWTDLAPFNTFDAGHEPRPPVAGQPRLVYSTAPSWRALAAELRQRFTAAAQIDPAVRERAVQLTERLATPAQKVDVLWRFVAADLLTVEVPPDDLDFTLAPAAEVLARSYGHCLDKAVLLSALLGAIGVAAEPVLVSRDTLFAAEVPALVQLGEVWLIAAVDGRARWIDPSALRGGDGLALLEGRTGLELRRGEPQLIAAGDLATQRNLSALVATWELGADGKLQGRLAQTLTGTYDPQVEVLRGTSSAELTGALLTEAAAGWKTDCAGCDQRVEQLDPVTAVFSSRGELRALGAGEVVEIALPWPARSQLAGADLHRANRDTTLELRSRGIETLTLVLKLPEGVELRSKLPAGELRTAVGTLTTRSARAGNELTIHRSLSLDRRIVDGTSYPALRQLQAELLRADHTSLLLVRVRAGS